VNRRARATLSFAGLGWALAACGGAAFTAAGGGGGTSTSDAASDVLGGGADVSAPSDAGLDAPLACDADLRADPAHCGRCGRSCLGAACRDAACEPVQLATGMQSPLGIALTESDVYIAAASEIRRVPKSGGAAVSFKSGLSSVAYLAIQGSTLYYTEYVPGGAVQSCVLPACAALTPVESGLTSPLGIAVGGTDLFFVDNGRARVQRKVLGQAGVTPLLTGLSNAEEIDVDAAYLFVAEQTTGRVLRYDRANLTAAPLVLASSPDIVGVAVDATEVFYTTQVTNGAVRAVPKRGGTPRVVIDRQASPSGVVVDAVAVYWTTFGDGRAWKVAR
jgi:hypothetical protein